MSICEKAKEILDDINNKIANRKIFQYNRESLIQALIISFNKAQVQSYFIGGPWFTDQIIEQYRAILKFVFRTDNERGPIPKDINTIVDEFIKMTLDFMDKYTPVRNYLDQCIIGTREFKYDEKLDMYYEDNYNSFSNYARMIDKIKDTPSDALKTEKLLMQLISMQKLINVFYVKKR